MSGIGFKFLKFRSKKYNQAGDGHTKKGEEEHGSGYTLLRKWYYL